MEWDSIKQLLNGEVITDKAINESEVRRTFRDKVLQIKEFSNLRKQIGGDNQIFDSCLDALKYEFYKKNSLVFYSGQKKERFYFILEGSCGTFTQKDEPNVNKEIKYFGQLQELQTSLKYQQNKLAQATALEDQQNALFYIKQLKNKISDAEAILNVYRKENDQQRLREAILGIEEQNLRNKLLQKHFSLNTLCLFTKEKSLISGDTIDQINLNGKDIKNTTITFEDTHVISISIEDYSRIFSHIVNQVYQCQRIMRSYFPDIPEEAVQMLSYEFQTSYFERNETIYHQNAQNPLQFFILIAGSVEIRKYGGAKKQITINSPQITKKENTNEQKTQTTKNVKEDTNNPAAKQSNLIENDYQYSDSDSEQTTKQESTVQKRKEEIQEPKLFTKNDPYHSIITFSGQQVFGTECYAKYNEYSAVSVSAETKVLVLDKRKFDLFDHLFNFKNFLKKQAKIQSKFYSDRLQKLIQFSQKMIEEQNQSRQFIQTHKRHKTVVIQSSNNLDMPQKRLLQTNNNQDYTLLQNDQYASEIQNLLQSSNTKNLTFKQMINQIIVEKNDGAEDEEQKTEQQLPSIKNQNKQIEHNKGFQFDKDSEKQRRENILIDHKVKKQLNFKSLPQKNEQKDKNANQIGSSYVQREGKFPWLDQFGFRKEMESNENFISLNQLESKMKNQDQIIQELGIRPSQQLSTLENNSQLNEKSNTTEKGPLFMLNIAQFQEKPFKNVSKRSLASLDLTNKQIEKIRSSINVLKEQDQQDNDQITNVQKMFSSSRIFKTPSAQLSINDLNAHSSQNLDSQSNIQPISLSNLENNRDIYRSKTQASLLFNSSTPNNQQDQSPFTEVQQRQEIQIKRRPKQALTCVQSQYNESIFKKSLNSQVSIAKISDDIQSIETKPLQTLAPLPTKLMPLIPQKLENLKKEQNSLENKASMKRQVSLLKKRNLISDHFSPQIKTNISLNTKYENSPLSNSMQILTDRFLDTQSLSKIRKFSDNTQVITPSSSNSQYFLDQSPCSLTNLTPSQTGSKSNQLRCSSLFKGKPSSFAR